MADVKWIKLSTQMFDDEKIRLIEQLPEADTILIIWVKLLSQAGKTNASGYIFLNENIPFTDEMISVIFNRPLPIVRLALQTLKQFGMIDITDKHFISITNWDKHQNIEGMERVRELNRTRKQRERDKKKELLLGSHVTVTQHHATELELDLELDLEKENNSQLVSYEASATSETELSPLPNDEGLLALQNAVQAIEDHYITKRASGTMVNADDYKKIMNLVEEGVPVDSIINGIDSAFDNHKPKYAGDKIRTFGYCETVIREIHYNNTQKDERNNERVTKKTLPPFKKNDRRDKLPSSIQIQMKNEKIGTSTPQKLSEEELQAKEARALELLREWGEID